MRSVYFIFQTVLLCNGPETEMKCKTDIEKQYNICILSYRDIWCLVLLALIYSATAKKMCVSVATIEK